MTQELVELTKDLIRFKTVKENPEEIERCADFIENWLKTNKIKFTRLTHEGIPSIIAMPESGFARVLLMSHIDVVSASDELFKPYVKDDRLFGRGSIDDKYAAALSMILMRDHIQKLAEKGMGQNDLPFGIMITGDEEIGGVNGAKYALGHVSTDFGIALDGGSPDNIIIKEKGILNLKISVHGKTAHGSRPWLGENAIEKLMDDCIKIKTLFKESSPDHWHKTLNLSVFNAGKSFNQVPDYAEALCDIRYTENDDPDQLAEEIRKTVSGNVSIEKKESVFFGGKSSYLDKLLEVCPDASLGFEHGASDARYLADHDTDGIVWGAEGENSLHADDEHITLESFETLFRNLSMFMDRI
ncbi:M20/M25/M40 family metallo-hydrolase [Desulfobacterales bacterium HSG16]|nr:M20/M25/M40 family metallo-hydrolase [Desulfobacterales bacterium HSG16]